MKRANGAGSIIRDKQRHTYKAVATSYATGQRLTKTKRGFRTKREAEAWLRSVNFALPPSHPVKFSELYAEWYALYEAQVSKKRASIIRGAYGKCACLYGMRWADVGVRHMQAIINEQTTYYPARDLKAMFSLMSQYAMVSGYADRDFTQALRLPSKAEPHKEPFTPEEIDLLWQDYKRTADPYTACALVMIYTGMRVGELVQATPDMVHLSDGYMLGGRKTETGKEGDIILVPAIRPLVHRLIVGGDLPHVSDTAFRKHYEKALARAGTRPHTIHECRHTTATALALAGVQPAIIAGVMRHSSYAQTMAYTHIGRSAKLEAVTSTLHSPND